jgi:AraC family transcriptional regulator, arabinose operon regulatory protein
MNFENVQVFRSDAKSRGSSISVIEFGRQKVSARINNRRLKDHAVVFVEKGRGSLTTQMGGTQDVQGPALFWLPLGQIHSYGPDPETSWLERWALFRGTMIADFYTTGIINADRPLVRLSNATEIAHIFAQLQSEMLRRDLQGWAAAASSLHRLIVQASLQSNARKIDASDKTASRLSKLIEAQAFDECSMDEIAGELLLSPATLRRRCIEAHGVAPKQYQIQLRVDRAKELLTMTDKSVEAIAAEVGYGDPFYFSRLFHKHENRSPTEFRKLHARR